jgi:Ran GTPase-activating protein (RanGAP) involved in mRNA processing and transport
LSSIFRIDLQGSNINYDGATVVANNVSRNSLLVSLGTSAKRDTRRRCRSELATHPLPQSFSQQIFIFSDISDNEIGTNGAEIILKALYDRRCLKEVRLSNCGLDESAGDKIASLFRENSSIEIVRFIFELLF